MNSEKGRVVMRKPRWKRQPGRKRIPDEERPIPIESSLHPDLFEWLEGYAHRLYISRAQAIRKLVFDAMVLDEAAQEKNG